MRQMAVWLFLGAVGFLLLGAPSWLSVAILAAVTFGSLVLIDVFFFKGDAYQDEWEPTVVSGVVQLLPWLVVPWFVDIRWTDASTIAMFAGFLCMASLVPYFRAMYIHQDAVVALVMWNLGIAVVPVLAFILLGETLSSRQYLGIGILFLGAMISTWERTAVRAKVIGLMLVAVVITSFYSIAAKEAFNILEVAGKSDIFWNMFLPFTLGEGMVAALASGIVWKKGGLPHLGSLVKGFWPVFLLMELVQLLFSGTSSLAVSLGPVSLVTGIEALSGAFAIILSILTTILFRKTRYAAITREVEAEQVSNTGRKLLGIAFLVAGAYLVAES